ncbi:MAG: glycosyltransferase family 2 protein [Kiritimatiellia bacterium]
MDKPTSVIILTRDKLECTRACLPGLLNTLHTSWELVVVDNGSTDGTRRWLNEFRDRCREAGAGITIVLNEPGTGCSTARNIGAGRADGEYLAFIDNDITLRSRSWLRKLAGAIEEDADTAAAGPKLVYPFEPYPIQCAGAAVSPSGRVQFRGRGEGRESPEYRAKTEVQCLISACMMVERKAFSAAGGFDEAFNPVEYEDIDLCYRMRSRGRRIVYLPSVEMYHVESVTTAGTPSLGNRRLIIKHGLLFKERWHHMFAAENGPPDAETKWRDVPGAGSLPAGRLPLLP